MAANGQAASGEGTLRSDFLELMDTGVSHHVTCLLLACRDPAVLTRGHRPTLCQVRAPPSGQMRLEAMDGPMAWVLASQQCLQGSSHACSGRRMDGVCVHGWFGMPTRWP